MFNFEVTKLNAEEEAKYIKSFNKYGDVHKLINLDIIGEKSAALLNTMLNWRFNSCSSKAYRHYSGGVEDLVGGGIFVKCMAQVVIDNLGNVSLLFKKYHKIHEFLRVAAGEDEILKAIKDKLGNELKKFWKSMDTSTDKTLKEITVKGLKENNEFKLMAVSFDEYRVLYEVLKGRDQKKIEKKYGTAAVNEMIGKKLEDQFVIAAIETCKIEINRFITERNVALKEAEEAYSKERDLLYRNYNNKKADIEGAAKAKIEEMEEQIKGLVLATNYSF